MDDGRRFAFRFVPAPADLAAYLNSLYELRISEEGVKEMLPAYSGQLLLVSAGAGRIDFGSGYVESPKHAFFIGPLSSARAFAIDGPALVIGASFTFHGWAALTRLPVAQNSDRFLDLGAAIDDDGAGAALSIAQRLRSGEVDVETALDELAEMLRRKIRPLSNGHADLIDSTYRWLSSSLNPDPAALFDQLGYSQRQAQRLVKRLFGLPPARLRRRYRAIRAATLLSDPTLDEGRRLEVYQAFYDQAHMIREIREFTGRTPKLLRTEPATVSGETLGAPGYGVVKLFAGDESEQLADE